MVTSSISGGSCPCCDCPTKPFPQPPVNFSITNWVELIFLDDLCKPYCQKMEMVPYTEPPKRLKEIIAMFGKHIEDYLVCQIVAGKIIGLEQDALITPKTTFYFINLRAPCVTSPQIILRRMQDQMLIRAGAAFPGSDYFTPVLNNWPIQMPSRFVTSFRKPGA